MDGERRRRERKREEWKEESRVAKKETGFAEEPSPSY